ncbi:MAG: hypothetical protein JRN09_02300 [Nitrososphaerota archaeon]|nr:hypothetical protein [Nitrososphaerota archaeon]
MLSQTPSAPQPRHVTVGLYLNDVATLDQTTGSFGADFYLWFRWQGNWTTGDVNSTVAADIATAKASPTGSFSQLAEYALPTHFELMNGQVDALALIAAQPDYNGSSYNFLEYRVHATMHDPMVLNNYPLDVQTLSIEIEDSFYPNSTLVYVPDPGSSIDPSITSGNGIPGWRYDAGSFSIVVTNHLYATAFGYGVIPGLNTSSSYSHFDASFTIRRPFANAVTTLLLPVAILLALTLVSFFISIDKFEERLALLVTAVLSAVLLQVNFAQNIPASGSFTLADRTIVVLYVVLVYGLAITVVQKWLNPEKHPRAVLWVDRVTVVIISIGATIAIWWLFYSVCDARICSLPIGVSP